LNARGCTTPVIIVTSDIQKSTEKRCRDLGVAAFMNKPVEKNQVISTVKDALKRS
jgi:twitching motility two-component system response regulator PilH